MIENEFYPVKSEYIEENYRLAGYKINSKKKSDIIDGLDTIKKIDPDYKESQVQKESIL